MSRKTSLRGWLVALAAEAGAVPVAWWVRRHEKRICALGEALTAAELELARLVGVRFPERVRVLGVEEVPIPCAWLARRGAVLAGRFPARALGLTARYGIYIQAEARWNLEILIHELVHTVQYERSATIICFLRAYLRDCIRHGYVSAPMEREARDVSMAALSGGGNSAGISSRPVPAGAVSGKATMAFSTNAPESSVEIKAYDSISSLH